MRAFALLWVLAATVHAEEPLSDAQRAQQLFHKGMTHFNLDEYEEAVRAWEAGYRIKAAPEFIFNIAQAYRKANWPERALTFYQRYLSIDPATRNRADVERHIVALEKLIEDQRRSAAAAPDQPLPAPKTVTTAVPRVEKPIVVAAPPPPPVVPLHRRWWLWTTVGVVVAGGVAVGLGVGLTQPQPFARTAADFGPGVRP
jgi:tetratricopeptide (TPR) repeat protein